MASRQAGFFVRHTEKLVLAVAAAFALLLVVVAWAGVFGSPSSERVGVDTVTPGSVQEVVKREADRLRQKLDATEPDVPDVTISDYSQEFAERIASPLLGDAERRLVAASGVGLPLQIFKPSDIEFPTYHLPEPPMATDTVVKAGQAVLADVGTIGDAAERERVVAIARNLGLDGDSPGDFQYVSAMARFPLGQWAERLENPDPDQANQPIPPNVWQPRLALASVFLLRQELDPVTDRWGDAERVELLPGQVGFLPDRPSDAEPLGRAEELVSFVMDRQEDIAQASFPPTRHVPWSPPGGRDRVFTPEEQEQLEALEKKIAGLRQSLTPREEPAGRDRDRGRNRTRPQRPGPGGGPGDLGGFDGPGGGPGATPRNRGNDRRSTRGDEEDPDARRARLDQERLAEAEAELADLLGEEASAPGRNFSGSRGGNPFGGDGFGGPNGFNDLGGGPRPGGGFGPPEGFGGPRAGRPAAGNDGPDADEELTVWAHDLSARPGRTYRYKLVAAPLNPLFRYSRVSESQRSENRERLALAPSDEALGAAAWSPPVVLNPVADFFFLGGNADQDRARIEVWKVFDGLWQRSEFAENPGNAIGGEERREIRDRNQRVNLATGALLLDVDVQPSVDSNPDQRMIYQDADGRIRSRTRQADSESERREQLQSELEAQNATQPAGI